MQLQLCWSRCSWMWAPVILSPKSLEAKKCCSSRIFIAELRRAERPSEAPWVRKIGKPWVFTIFQNKTGWDDRWIMVTLFFKISKPTEQDGAYHLLCDFSLLFSADERLETGKIYQMARKFPSFRSEWEKRNTSEGTPQFPNGISGKSPYHWTWNRNFWIFWPNGKHPIKPRKFGYDVSVRVNERASKRSYRLWGRGKGLSMSPERGSGGMPSFLGVKTYFYLWSQQTSLI